ncbi:hypothetical protein SNE40_006094 [Patella caerulea]|uniref:CUB domain-containing protein n=1 Tax=Patella caerulea TaxID=87958 RepID=A0AAN8PZH3_PATCE
MDRLLHPLILLTLINVGIEALVVIPVNVTTDKQILSSPNYPNSYPYNLDTKWQITTFDPSYRLAVEVLDFQFEDSNFCAYDKLMIHDGGVFRGAYCTNSPQSFFTESSNLTLRFITDNTIQDRGFQFRIHATLHNPFLYTGLSVGEIIGIVVGVLFFLVLVIGLLYYLIKRSQHKNRKVTIVAQEANPPLTARLPLPPIRATKNRPRLTFYDTTDSIPGSIPPAFTYAPPTDRKVFTRTGNAW